MTRAGSRDAPDEEVLRLRSALNDLVSALALSSLWNVADPAEIVRTMLEALRGMLRLELVYFQGSGTGTSEEAALGSGRFDVAPTLVRAELYRGLGADWRGWSTGAAELAGAKVSLAVVPLGLDGETGVLVAAAPRPDFPSAHELLLLRVAANQAVLALHGAQRTRELTNANAALEREIAERRRAEAALRESEQTARSLLDGMPGFVAVLSADGRVEMVNRRILDYCGQTLEELQHWGENGTIHEQDLPQVLEIFLPSIADGVPYLIEQRLRRYDGTYRWFDNRGIPVRDEAGRVARWYVLLSDVDDRKKAQQALATSAELFRQSFDAIPTLAWCNRTDGSNEFLNKRWHEYTGLTPEQANGWGWQVALHPDDLPALLHKWQHMLATGECGEIEARLRRHDGVYRWFLFRCDPLRDARGEVVRWYGTNTDIDDVKRAERALAASERTLQLTIDTLPAIVWSANPAGEAEYFNKHFLDFVGLPLSEVRGWKWTELIHPDDIEALAEAWQRFRAAGTPGEVEARYRRYDGVYRWFLFRGQPFRDEHGEIVSWYGINADIEDRKRVEEALAESERENRQIAHSIAGMVAVFSPDGELNGGNQQLLDYFQLPLEEIGRWATNGITHPDDLQHCIDTFMGSVASGEPYDYETRFRRHDGEFRWFQLRGRPLRDAEGRIVRWYGLLTDIEDRKRAEAAIDKVRSDLAHVTRALSLSALTASIAHEVNQPLSGIITNANTSVRMLSADPPNVEGALETARRTIRDGHRASDVITRLRALYRRKDFATELLDLNEAAQEVLTLSAQELHRRGIVVQAEFAAQLPLLMGDRVQLQQVILNLILNAADAMNGVARGSRRLVVETTAQPPGSVRLTVRDTGIGLAEAQRAKIFDPFYTTKEDGMGIGLYVSRSIIDRHFGELCATSNEGPGATFSFSIPCAPPKP